MDFDATKIQELMNEVYDAWNKQDNEIRDQIKKTKSYEEQRELRKKMWSQRDVLEQFSEKHRLAVMAGNLNYQVCNGGFLQWHDNEYSELEEELMEALRKVGTPLCMMMKAHIEEYQTRREDAEDDNSYYSGLSWAGEDEDDEDYYEEEEEYEAETGDLDTSFYKINEKFILEVEAFIKGEELSEAQIEEHKELVRKHSVVAIFFEPKETEVKKESSVKFPEITVKLVGTDGNAFAIIGNVSKALRRGGASMDDVKEFQDEATSGDYNNVLQTAMKWVEVT